jgi:4-hydroxybenzoate polyprenyltransferase
MIRKKLQLSARTLLFLDQGQLFYHVTMPKTVLALISSSHPGPCVVVTIVGAILGFALGYPPERLIVLTLTVLTGQLSIGWSNDWLDAGRDAEVHRTDKPTVNGAISATTLRTAAVAAAVATVILSLILGPLAALANLVVVGMGWAYNAGLKNSLLSVVPYAVSFGSLPVLATLGGSPPRVPEPWVVVVGALLGIAAHFTNVLPDLNDDKATGVRGFPHLLGGTASGILAFLCLAAAAVLLTFGPSNRPTPVLWVGLALGIAIAALGIVLTLRSVRTRFLMQLIMTGAVIDVVMLALAGQSIAR